MKSIMLAVLFMLAVRFVAAEERWTPIAAKQRSALVKISPDGTRQVLSEKAGGTGETAGFEVIEDSQVRIAQ